MLSSLFRNIFGKVNNDARKYFCSEFVWLNWVAAGYMAVGKDVIKAPRPGDFPAMIGIDPIIIEEGQP